MSAYMVTKAHIDALVTLAYFGPVSLPGRSWHKPYIDGKSLGYEDLSALGEMLIEENLKSIHARYPDTVDNPEATPGPCERYWEYPYLHQQGKRLTIMEGIKALNCYTYQSCEHSGWRQSEAARICETLKNRLISLHPEYEKAEWEID